MEIGLRVCALGLVFFSYQVPLLLGGGAMHKVHFGGVGEPLRQEVACNGVLVLPLDDSSCLVLGRFSGVDGLGIRVEACEEDPSTGYLHSVTEAHLEDGPVRAIVLEGVVCRLGAFRWW